MAPGLPSLAEYTMPRSRPSCLSVLALVAAAGLTVGLGGCGDQDRSAENLAEASRTIRTANAGVGAPPRPELLEDTYRKVREKADPVRQSELAEQAAAASLMVAETQLGEAAVQEVALARAVSGFTTGKPAHGGADALLGLDDVRAQFNRLSRLRTEVDLANAFTVADEVATLESQVAQRDRDQAVRQRELDELTRLIEARQAELAAKEAESAQERARASELKLQAASEPSGKAVELAERARLFDRSADGVAFEAELIRAELDSLRPDRARLVNEVDRITSERGSLVEAIERLRAAQREARARGSEAAARAGELERRIQDMLFGSGSLVTERVTQLANLTDEVTGAYEKAGGTARQGSALRRQASFLQGRASAGAGSAHMAAARAYESAILLLSDLAAQGVGGDRVGGAIQSLETRRTDAYNAAGDAFDSASGQFGADAAGASYSELSAQARARAASPAGTFDPAAFTAAQELARAEADLGGDDFADDGMGDFADSDMAGGGSAGDPSGDLAGELNARVDEILTMMREGRTQQILAFSDFDDRALQARYRELAASTDAMMQLELACQEHIGEGIMSSLAAMSGQPTDALDRLSTVRASDLRIEVDGDFATVYFPHASGGEDDAWDFVHNGSEWRVVGASMTDRSIEDMEAMGMPPEGIDAITRIANTLRARVERGEFGSAAEVAQAFVLGMAAQMGGMGGG